MAQAEAEIDELVYDLYGLTKDEIKIIEESMEKSREVILSSWIVRGG